MYGSLLTVITALGVADYTVARHTSFHAQDTACSYNGQFVVNPADECSYYRCDYASYDISTNSRFVAILMKCPFGTASNIRHFDPYSPCGEKSDACRNTGVRYEYIPGPIEVKHNYIQPEEPPLYKEPTHYETPPSKEGYVPPQHHVPVPVTYETHPHGLPDPVPDQQHLTYDAHPEAGVGPSYEGAKGPPVHVPDTHSQHPNHNSYGHQKPQVSTYHHPNPNPSQKDAYINPQPTPASYHHPQPEQSSYHHPQFPAEIEAREAPRHQYHAQQGLHADAPYHKSSYIPEHAPHYEAQVAGQPKEHRAHHSYSEHSSYTMQKTPHSTEYHMTSYKSPGPISSGDGLMHHVPFKTDANAHLGHIGPILDDDVNVRVRRKLYNRSRYIKPSDFVHPVDFERSFNRLARVLKLN